MPIDVSATCENGILKLDDSLPYPQKAEVDTLHIATTAVHGIDYLLTWNCKHIANATMRLKIESICKSCGYEPPNSRGQHEL